MMSTNTTSEKSDYMLLFRGTRWDKDLSPEDIQRILGQWGAWFERLGNEGKVKGGHPLESEGKIVSGSKGKIVTDGPFAESKEAIGGYFMLHVADMDEAVRIAQECPALDYGLTVEVRQVANQCMASKRVREFAGGELAHVHA